MLPRYTGIGASIVVGLIFLISGVGKLLNQAEFLDVVLGHPLVPSTLANEVAHVLPWIESVLGALLLIGISARLMASFSSVLVTAFIATNIWLVAHGKAYEACGCLGIFERVFLGNLSTIVSLYLDIGLLGLALIILAYYPAGFITVRPWFLRSSK